MEGLGLCSFKCHNVVKRYNRASRSGALWEAGWGGGSGVAAGGGRVGIAHEATDALHMRSEKYVSG